MADKEVRNPGVHIVNPSGRVVEVPPDHIAIDKARRGQDGWRVPDGEKLPPAPKPKPAPGSGSIPDHIKRQMEQD